MKYYQEITLLPDAEINLYFIWQKTYQQIHLALVEIQNPQKQVEVGVSFPQYDEKTNYLGCKLRLFAKDKTILNQLNLQKWLHRLNDYTHLTKIRDVPDTVTEFAQFKRQQVKSNAKKVRHAKRQAKRDNIEFEQAFNKQISDILCANVGKIPNNLFVLLETMDKEEDNLDYIFCYI